MRGYAELTQKVRNQLLEQTKEQLAQMEIDKMDFREICLLAGLYTDYPGFETQQIKTTRPLKGMQRMRRNRNLTQQELAKKMGCSTEAIHSYECGRREPDLHMLL